MFYLNKAEGKSSKDKIAQEGKGYVLLKCTMDFLHELGELPKV